LIAAVRSASRLRGQPVHADTIKHWADLLHHARRELSTNAALHRNAEAVGGGVEVELTGARNEGPSDAGRPMHLHSHVRVPILGLLQSPNNGFRRFAAPISFFRFF
jgi:hypothetical protein